MAGIGGQGGFTLRTAFFGAPEAKPHAGFWAAGGGRGLLSIRIPGVFSLAAAAGGAGATSEAVAVLPTVWTVRPPAPAPAPGWPTCPRLVARSCLAGRRSFQLLSCAGGAGAGTAPAPCSPSGQGRLSTSTLSSCAEESGARSNGGTMAPRKVWHAPAP